MRYKCSCKWGEECFYLHNQFKKNNDPRGKDPIRLDLSGETELKFAWEKVVLNNLGINEKMVKNLK